MEKTTRYAEIPQLRKGVAFSDPIYDENVWCQYRKEFYASSGWVMKMETSRDQDNLVEFTLSLGRRTMMSGLSVIDKEDGSSSILHYGHYELEAKEIGIDSACVFVGSLENFERFGEEGSIYTAADGLFGDLHIFTSKGEQEPAGFLLVGAIDGGITDEDNLFRTVMASFDGHEIDRERFEKMTNPNDLEIRKQLVKEIRKANSREKDQADGQHAKSEKRKDVPER